MPAFFPNEINSRREFGSTTFGFAADTAADCPGPDGAAPARDVEPGGEQLPLQLDRPRPGEAHKRGRGLQLIEAHMDEVDISTAKDGGTTIHMAKVEKKNG